MYTITATEFKNNLGKYLELGLSEDILITKNGKPLVKLTSANGDAFDKLFELSGIFKDVNLTLDDTRLERIKR